MEKWLSADLDGEYEIVVHSEGVEPHLGRPSELGFLPTAVNDPVALAVSGDSPDGSVILIKGRPNSRSYRLFHVVEGGLAETANGGNVNNWTFSSEGMITQQVSEYSAVYDYVVYPAQWGYCEAIEKGWTPKKHKEETLSTAGVSSSDNNLDILNLVIHLRRRGDRAEAALRHGAEKLRGQDLLDDGYDGKKDKGKQKGHLRSAIDERGGVAHCAAGAARDLREIYELLRQVLPDLPPLSSGALTG